MWTIERTVSGSTNKFTIVTEGKVNVNFPPGVRVKAYVNEVRTPINMLDVKVGDIVYFKLKNSTTEPQTVTIEHLGTISTLELAAHSAAPTIEEDIMSPTDTLNLFAGSGTQGGAMGTGLGAGLLGGVLGGALLGGNGGLLGNNNRAVDPLAAVTAQIQANSALTDARFNAQSQQAIEAAIERTNAAALLAISTGNAALGVEVAKGNGDLGVLVAKGFGDANTQIALTTAALGVQNEKTAAANALSNAMGQRDIVGLIAAEAAAAARQTSDLQYALSSQITADGNQTRALITTNNDLELNRRLVVAQNEIIELRGDRRLHEVGSGITISNNNNAVANAQQQQAQQQQQQISYLSNQLAALIQQNQHIQQGVLNIGSGTVSGNSQTAANTKVNGF